MNPWNGRCRRTDIEVYIWFRGRKLPICRRCWAELAEKPFEWGGAEAVKRVE